MSKQIEAISPRARAIADGLVRTGRAAKHRAAGKFLRVDGAGVTYWIAGDGWRLLRGDRVETSDELQRGFLERMLQAGSVTAATLERVRSIAAEVAAHPPG